MDEEDSQDELINRNVSHGKGKRPAMSIVSDDEDNSEDGGESEQGETNSEEDASEEEILDGEEEDEEDDDSEDEDSCKVLEGAVGNVAADAVDLSSDEDSEKCPICLNSFHEQPVATPEACEHYFCLDCILEWSNNANSCPVDRKVFNNILLRKCHGGKVQKTIAVQKPVKPGQEEQVDVDLDQTSCEVCGGRDREDRLLLCDGCDAGYHMECLTPPLDAVPVEEWFCPECIANNRSSGSDQVSEEESSLPTTSRLQSRPTRAIARTQHSERVRANVNRRRITQARTAAELAPRYLMQSTWLDETINAVVAGLNTAVYVRDLTPRAKSRRRRKTAKRRKTSGKSVTAGKTNLRVKRRKRKVRRSKLRRKLVLKKETNSRGRIAQSLGIKKARRGSLIPSVYRPSENSLGSMRAEIGAASLSVYGDPFDLDPFDDREDVIQVPTPPSVLDAKRRGLSRSALRSHQPVARPITAGLSRRGVSIPQAEEVASAGPVPDLLGSILSGQSMLLMDSSDVVINRDGSLKATKPVCLSLPRSTTPNGSSSGEAANLPNSETSSGGLSSSPLRRPPSDHTSPSPCSIPQTLTSPHFPYSQPSSAGNPRLNPGPPSRPVALNTQRVGNGIRSLNSLSDPQHQDKGSTCLQPPVKKPPPKPVWLDVSILPRIPKIKKAGASSTNNNRGCNNNSLPESSMTLLAGDTGREHTVDQQGTSNTQPNRTMDARRQRPDRTGSSSTFSNSFTSTTSSLGASSNSCPSTSSSVSFRISTSGNPWHTRRLSASGGTSPGNNEGKVKKNEKSKPMLSLKPPSKEVKREVYDPFNPTGSDSSDSELENKGFDFKTKKTESKIPAGPNEDACNQIKSEPMDVDPERGFEICPVVLQSDMAQIQTPSCDHVVDSSSSESRMDINHGGTPERPIKNSDDLSESSLTCSVKTEVKSEPEDGPAIFNPQSTSPKKEILVNPQQGNRVCKELPAISAPLNATKVAKEEKTAHKSQSRRRSPSSSQSPFNDKQEKKHSRSKEKRRSRSNSRERLHSKSKERQRSRSRSRDKKPLRSRDGRSSSSSSSRERKPSRKSLDKSDRRGRERRKRSKEKWQSLSFSRSRDRRRTSKDRSERSKRHKSRSTSRERQREDQLESDRRREKSKNTLEAGVNKTATPSKREKDSKAHESKNKISLPSVKQEGQTLERPTADVGSSSHDDPIRTHTESKNSPYVSNELKMFGLEEIKQEKLSFFDEVELKYIKKEEEIKMCEESESDIVKQETSLDVFNEKSTEQRKINLDAVDFRKTQDDETKAKDTSFGPKNMKIEQIWPDEEYSPCCSDNPLVISLEMPDVDCMKENMDLSPLMDEMAVTSEDPIKQEPVDTSDDDINVDYLIDNLDFIKKEMSESSAADSTDTGDLKSTAEEAQCENKTVIESVTGGVKSKSQGKRVTWNLQEPDAPSSEKQSKIALFKLKLKQDGFRRTTVAQQTSSQDKAQTEQKLIANVSSPLSQDESSRRISNKEKLLQDPHQKEEYITKLHMQERAIEEVKLAIKPFYQKRDITKEEYKDILRKAVQKVCHSKSGEINPVKVANLVKAYVDKFKHARKHKNKDSKPSQRTDPINMQMST